MSSSESRWLSPIRFLLVAVATFDMSYLDHILPLPKYPMPATPPLAALSYDVDRTHKSSRLDRRGDGDMFGEQQGFSLRHLEEMRQRVRAAIAEETPEAQAPWRATIDWRYVQFEMHRAAVAMAGISAQMIMLGRAGIDDTKLRELTSRALVDLVKLVEHARDLAAGKVHLDDPVEAEVSIRCLAIFQAQRAQQGGVGGGSQVGAGQ